MRIESDQLHREMKSINHYTDTILLSNFQYLKIHNIEKKMIKEVTKPN